jgi:hypothetical protein
MTETSKDAVERDSLGGICPMAKVTSDFDFLDGAFDVTNRRLIRPLAGSDAWEDFSATAVARTHFNGAVSIDEMHFPTKGFCGMSIRLFDPTAWEWTVYWVDSRTGRLQPPVRGRWVDGASLLFGDDEHDGLPVRASYRWTEVTDRTARWEQGFSVDGGASWETNWIMNWSRRDCEPPAAALPKVTDGFDFLVGQWGVHHRLLSKPLAGGGEWREFSGVATARSYFNGGVSNDEFHFPSRGSRGMTVRLYEPGSRQWSIYWVSSLDGKLGPPVRGEFSGGVGEFYGDDVYGGRTIRVRYLWKSISQREAHWEQAFSADAGTTWETNWLMRLIRTADYPPPGSS